MQNVTTHSYRTFLVVWFGQTISMLGTGLTGFGVSVWVFLETGSITSLAIVLFATLLPRSLLAPFAGAYVDRWNRRTAMIVSDAGAGAATVVLAAMFILGEPTVLGLAIVAAVSSAFAALQWPAYQAATTLLVPKQQYSRAQGLIQLSGAAGNLLPPMLAAAVLAVSGIGALIAIDIVTFLVAVGTLLIVRFPAPPESKVGAEAKESTVLSDAAFGFIYIHRRPGWRGLLGLQFVMNIASGFFFVLITGYLLTVSDEQTLGIVMSTGALGSLAGAALMTAWKGARSHKVLLIVLAVVASGVLDVLFGLAAALWVATAFLFVGSLTRVAQNTTYRALWQAKVEPDVQGRVFSARMMIVVLAMPLAFVLAGPLMDHVFVPLVQSESGVGSVLRTWFGDGEAAPYRAFIGFTGLLTVAAAIGGWLYGPLRHLERDIPDFDRA
jgi:DHA3 family macrolide efflux protein-like MFS transporter